MGADTEEEVNYLIEKGASYITCNDIEPMLKVLGRAYVLADGIGVTVPAAAAKLVDTIGAGDAHIGAMMAGCAAGLTLPEAAAQANRMSAAVISISGATLTAAQWQAWRDAHNE